VLDPLSGYLRLGQGLLAGEAIEGPWNFGPAADATLPVQTLVSRMQADWPGLRTEHESGPHLHEAEILRLDCSKAERDLGWRPVWDANTTLERTSHWYRDFYESGRLDSADDLRAYLLAARNSGLSWAT
jgi:CDP-glucose 4,6-dehydratase